MRQAFLRAGASLAEFNGLTSEQRASLARSESFRIVVEFDRLFSPEVKAKVQGKCDLGALRRSLNRKLKKILHRLGKFYQHGDAGLKNFFYDAASDKSTLIDVSRIHHRISKSGKPLCHSLYDFVHMWRKLAQEVNEHLNREEQEMILEAFYFGYVDAVKPDGNLRHHKTLYDKLLQVKLHCNYDEIPDPAERKKQHDLFLHYCNYIKKIK